jgi:hypothetical protein
VLSRGAASSQPPLCSLDAIDWKKQALRARVSRSAASAAPSNCAPAELERGETHFNLTTNSAEDPARRPRGNCGLSLG